MSHILATLSVLMLSVGLANTARAECAVYYPFEHVLKESPIAVVGKVITVNPGRVVLEVNRVVKGPAMSGNITVWDPQVSGSVVSSVNAELHRLKVGAEIVLAGFTVAEFPRDYLGNKSFDRAEQPNDLAVVACRQAYRLLDSATTLLEIAGGTIP